MLLPKCFICDTKTLIYCENIITIRSCHTDTPVMDILKKFAKDLEMDTILPKNRYKSTVICQLCMIKINEYDLACMTAKQMEKQLKELLQKKEEEVDDSKSDSDYNPDGISGDEADDKHQYKVEPKGMEVRVMRCNVCNINFKR